MIYRLFVATVMALLSVGIAHAQTDYNSRRGEVARIQERDYNIRIGELQLDFIGRTSVTYDDNVNRSNSNRDDGTTARFGLDTGVFWAINPDMIFDLRIDLGYTTVISGEGTEGLSIRAAETSSFSVDMRVGNNGLLSIVDTLTIKSVTTSIQGDQDDADYRQLENDLGIQYEVDPSPYWDAGLRIGRRDLRVLDDSDFDHRNLVTYYASGRVDWEINEQMDLGPYANYRLHQYVESGNNDSTEWEGGLRWFWAFTDFTRLSISAGWQHLEVDSNRGTAPGTSSTLDEPTGRLHIDSELSEQITHGVALVYEHRPTGTLGVNFSENLSARYYVNWTINPHVILGYSFRWLNSKELAPAGEEFDAFENILRLTWILGPKISTYAEYRRADKDSDISGANYRQNRATLGMAYNF